MGGYCLLGFYSILVSFLFVGFFLNYCTNFIIYISIGIKRIKLIEYINVLLCRIFYFLLI